MRKGKDHVWKSKELTPGGGQLTQQRIRSGYKRKGGCISHSFWIIITFASWALEHKDVLRVLG
jgi:hypothetical protein